MLTMSKYCTNALYVHTACDQLREVPDRKKGNVRCLTAAKAYVMLEYKSVITGEGANGLLQASKAASCTCSRCKYKAV
jgi:hypothetical protein